MATYTEEGVISYLTKRGVKFDKNAKVAEVRPGTLGIKTLGKLDYLAKTHKYIIKYVKGK